MERTKHYAIVPAAGLSLRMGDQHKLLLPWRNATLMDAVLETWTRSRVAHVVLVVRRHDSALRQVCERWPVEILSPEVDPVDMKMSIRHGLEHIAWKHRPGGNDRWLVAPADLPSLSVATVDQLVAADSSTGAIVVPRFGQRRGHPVSFPWSLHTAVDDIPDSEGLHWLLAKHAVQWLDLPATALPEDIDTPQDYRRQTQLKLP